jgi:hypothetical protein
MAALLILLLAQSGVLSKPEKIDTDIPLLVVESPPSPPPVPRQEIIARLPKPPAVRTPPIASPPPPTPDRPLLGWTSHGETPGAAVRPPGPIGDKLGPEPPGKGKGMKDAGNPADAGDASPPPAPAAREESPKTTGPPPDTLPPWPSGDYGRQLPPSPPPAPSGKGSGPGRPGRPGAPGEGDDFNVGLGGSYFGDIQFESGEYPWSDYSSKLYFEIYWAWLREMYGRVPRFERDQTLRGLPNLDGEVAIRFVLRRHGPGTDVTDVEILRPSPVPALDESSSRALLRAVLPPMPADFPRDHERVIFTFRLSGFVSSQQLQRRLEDDLAGRGL